MQDLDLLEQKAIDAAINSHWEDAVKLNKQIIANDKNNTTAYLRLGFASLQMEEIASAQKYYQKALKLQPRNPVAIENLERLEILQTKKGKNPIKDKAILNPNLFLEVPGKTKNVTLVNLGQKNILAELDIGESVELKPKTRKIEVRTSSKDYIGTLPDDLSKRLLFFLKAKSLYKAYVKEATSNRVMIFIQELEKGKKVVHYSSFPQNIQANLARMNSNPEETDTEDDSVDEFDPERLEEAEKEIPEDYNLHEEREEEEE